MRTSQPERRTPTIRQFVMVMAAVTWLAVLLPVGAKAAGQLVTLADPVTSQQARVVAPGALRVAEFNDPARTSFTTYADMDLQSGQLGGSVLITTVPAGQRLVIETISVHLHLPAGERTQYAAVQAFPNRNFYIPLFFSGAYSGFDHFQGTEQVRIYANPQTDVTASWIRNSLTSSGGASFSISGHFVKL